MPQAEETSHGAGYRSVHCHGHDKETIAVAVAEVGRSGEVRFLGEIPNRADAVRRLLDKLASKYGQLSVCYEAGPCGYGLHRQITELGHACIVVAPSLIPIRAGDRVKTDWRLPGTQRRWRAGLADLVAWL